MGAGQALANVCVLGDYFGIQASAGGLSGRGTGCVPCVPAHFCSECFHLSGCGLGQKLVFGVTWSLWKVNDSFLAGGVASQVTPHVWDQCVCAVNPKEVIPALSLASGDWKFRKKRFTDHGFVSAFLEHPQSCVCPCGKIQFCHQELFLTSSLQSSH